jgi:hypothetical protein
MFKILTLLVLPLLPFGVSSTAFAEELVFPFTVDETITNEVWPDTLHELRDIQNDRWFMSPPTRLELLTYAVDQFFKQKVLEYWKYDGPRVERYFERYSKLWNSPDVAPAVYFSTVKDLFVAIVRMRGFGKPKKPMKEVCQEVLVDISSRYLTNSSGCCLYQNTFLQPFVQTAPTDPELVRIATVLENNMIVKVELTAAIPQSSDAAYPNDHFEVWCYKSIKEKEIHYEKHAYRLHQ